MKLEMIACELVDRVAIIRLDNASELNVMSRPMAVELIEALNWGEKSAASILLSNSGRAFCAGVNLQSDGMQLENDDRDLGFDLRTVYNPLMQQIRGLSVPIISAVRGAVIGVGCSIALAADMIVASADADFIEAFRNVGLVPDAGSTFLLTRAVGRPRAMEMMLLGEKVTAATALEWGLVNRVVSNEALDEEAFALARKLAAGPKSLGMIRRVAWQALDSDFATSLELESMAQRDAGRTMDYVEGIKAFREKRAARYSGM